MNWDICLKEHIKKVEPDNERIESIKRKAILRLKRARETKVTLENVSFVVEDYYEVVKELLVAYMLKNGLRSKNHQCLISYFYKENPNHEKEAFLVSQMSYFRNRLDYYGEDVPMAFYQDNKDDFERLIDILIKMIETDPQ